MGWSGDGAPELEDVVPDGGLEDDEEPCALGIGVSGTCGSAGASGVVTLMGDANLIGVAALAGEATLIGVAAGTTACPASTTPG